MRICSEIHFYPLDNKIFIKANKNAVRGCQKPTEVYYAAKYKKNAEYKKPCKDSCKISYMISCKKNVT